jgi:hypothetical protein
MKWMKLWIFFLATILILDLFANEDQKQRSNTEDKKIRQWQKWLREYPPSKNSTELKLQFSFPRVELANKDIYLWRARRIANDISGNIFVLDPEWRSIFKFDSKGNYIKKIGRKGQGPGEFMNPYCFSVTDKHVIVSDTNSRQIKIFDLDLNLIKTFRVFKAYTEIAVNDDGLIFGTPMRMNRESPLVDVLKEDGQLLYSFGKAMFGNKRHWNVPNWSKIDINKNGEVFLAFQYFPTVCKYSLKGKLLAVYKIIHKVMNERERINLKGIKDVDNRVYWPIIYSIRAKDQGFYILHNSPLTQVLEYDGNGKMINDYWFARSHDYIADDFIVKNKNGVEFFFLERRPENKIEVFRPKRTFVKSY